MQSLKIPLTREQLEAYRQKAAESGFVFKGDSGDGETKGVKYSYNYDGAALEVTIKHVSFAVKVLGYGEDKIISKMKEKLKEEGLSYV